LRLLNRLLDTLTRHPVAEKDIQEIAFGIGRACAARKSGRERQN
jgi:hypothetical protein